MKYTNWLAQASSPAELKKLYHQLARQHHPDRGGDTESMQQINAEYTLRLKLFQAGFTPYAPSSKPRPAPTRSRPAGKKTTGKASSEWERLNISYQAWQAYQGVQKLREGMPFPGGLVVEAIGGRVRVRGKATYHYSNQLKALGFVWDSTVRYWYFVRKPSSKKAS